MWRRRDKRGYGREASQQRTDTGEGMELRYVYHRLLPISAKETVVLLLDEADIFLEERSMSDLKWNRLVSGIQIIWKQHHFKASSSKLSQFSSAF